jgi:serine/threonine protein kinase
MGEGKMDKLETKKYIESEIELLKILHHPNIVGFEGYKITKDCYYVTMEFINGGSLSDCLKKFKKKYGKAFSEEIIQHLMKQIISALKFIHSKKVIHRDLKLDNIMASFGNENDKKNVNMLRAKVKIIDFGTAIKVGPNKLASTIIGSPINMDPAILKKFTNMMSSKAIRDPKQSYDEKVDIWSIGTACYEMLIGKPCFDAESLSELVSKVEEGSYSLPTIISKEMVSFLNAMLQYEPEKRLSSAELENHPFLKKRVSDFEKIDIKRVKRKIDNKGLNINVKKNQTIWSIFNENDEQIFVNINSRGTSIGPLVDYNNNDYIMKTNTMNLKNREAQYIIPINNKYNRRNSSNYSQKIGLG